MKTERQYLWLSRSMLWGSVYDLLFGLPILLFPVQVGGLLNIACPVNLFYVRFCGLFLLILAAGYLIAWRDIQHNLGIVRLMMLSRTLGFFFMGGFALIGGMESIFYLLAGADLLFALLHLVFFVRRV